MSPALVAHQSAALLRPMTRRRNRRRHTAARASLRRVTVATLAAGALTLAALAASALDRWTAESHHESTEHCADYATGRTDTLLFTHTQHAGETARAAAFKRAAERMQARYNAAYADRVNDWQADEDDIAAADARLMDFIRGTASHVDEADLEIASPAIRARAFEKLD